MAGLLSFLLNLSAVLVAVGAYFHSAVLLPSLAVFIIAGAYRAYIKGTLAELLSFLRIGLAFAIAWFFKSEASTILPIKGLYGEIASFYSLFLITYILAGQAIGLALKNHFPSKASQFLGALIGAFEGLLIGLFVFVAMSLLPESSLSRNPPDALKFISGSVEKIVAPIMPEQASNAVRAIKTMGKLSQGIDPAKVDSRTLAEVMQPIAQLPEVREVQNNPVVQQLVAQKDIPRLIQHPAVKKLFESPQLRQKMLELDWKKLERALGQKPSGY